MNSNPSDQPKGGIEPSVRPVIRLDDFLKAMGMVGTGGEAKLRIQSGEVSVNGEVETRRRKQLAPGDQVRIDDETHYVPEGPL